jgi:hypothetical protein
MVVAVPPDERVTVVVLRLVVGPDGVMAEMRLIVPVNPLMLVNVIVDVPDEPA